MSPRGISSQVTSYQIFVSAVAASIVASNADGGRAWKALIGLGALFGVNIDVLFGNNELMLATFSLARAYLVCDALKIGMPSFLNPVEPFLRWTLTIGAMFHIAKVFATAILLLSILASVGMAKSFLEECGSYLMGDNLMASVRFDPFEITIINLKKEGMSSRTMDVLFPPQLPAQRGLPSENTECSICACGFEMTQIWRKLICGHVFHAECIDKWICDHDTCPTCRNNFSEAKNIISMEELSTFMEEDDGEEEEEEE